MPILTGRQWKFANWRRTYGRWTSSIIGRPSWSLREPPTCAQTCAPPDEAEHGELFVVTQVRAGDALATRRCRTLGLPPAAVFEIEDAATGVESARSAGMEVIAITNSLPANTEGGLLGPGLSGTQP